MASRRFKWTAAGSTVAAAGLTLVGYSLIAAQGQGVLAQAPLNNQVQTPPAFIMAVDDSGSMTFQTQFPGMDGEGCWNTNRRSFFDANGQLYTSGNCDYFYVLPGTRINNYYGIPPIDSLGFARSSEYNPTYFNPTVKYEPWINGAGASYGDANTGNTRTDPRNGDTVALASNYYSTAGADSFRMQNGMVIPANTFFRYNNQNYQFNTDYTWNSGAATVYMQYWPATFYVKWVADNDAYPQMEGGTNTYNGVARTKVSNACGTGCTMWKYTIAATNTAALQNFANWYSYYGNRNRAMIAGMTRSLASVNNLRVGYFRINQNGSYDSGTNAGKRLTMRDMATQADKLALYTDMIALTASGGTPNRQAVNAAALQFTRTDSGSPIQLACQKNAVMLFTDGFSNGGGPTVGNNDANMGIPFSDGNSSTMADIVSQYYVNNGSQPPLRPDLAAGQVPVVSACKSGNPDKRLDCQTNLHLNFYGVTLGARGNLFDPDLDQDPYADASIYGNWPPRQDDQRSTVDDIWHATVNTRGEYINARTPADITSAMRRVLSSVTSGAAPAGGSGASGARIGTGSLTATASYEIANEGTDWFSRLNATRYSVDPVTNLLVETSFWEASAQLQSATSRRVFFTKNGATREFNGNNVTLDDLCTKSAALYPGMSRCTAAELTALGVNAATAVAYLRGDTSGEKRNSGRLRDRTTRLGDIVNSSPVISSPRDDNGYRGLGGTLATSYQTYLANKLSTGRYMVYVGANDGMLHAFNGGLDATGTVVAGGGTEAFAYVPGTALGHMGNLLFPYDSSNKNDQKFDHRYFVDGQITVSDSFYGNAWHTTLVGASGAGGRSVFALDVTQGSTFSAGSKLWEISDVDTNLSPTVRANIGHVLGKPVIVPVLSAAGVPSWKAVFGNGFNSASGKAVLFVVDIESGAVTMSEAVEGGTGVPAGSNGLASVVVLDRWGGTGQAMRTRDGYADTVYAADQKGAIWKFDLRTPANLSTPLFTTRSYTEAGQTQRQPITGGLTVGTGTNGGVMLYFGTGSFSFVGDQADTSVQSIYAVNDVSGAVVTTKLSRSNLNVVTLSQVGNERTAAVSTVVSGSRGWYTDLPAGERFVGIPNLDDGTLTMSTYVPQAGNAGCSTSGTNWFNGFEALTGNGALGLAYVNSMTNNQLGGGTSSLKYDTANGGPVTNNPPFALPRQRPPELGPPGSAPPTPPPVACWKVHKVGTQTLYLPYACGRQSWRQIQ